MPTFKYRYSVLQDIYKSLAWLGFLAGFTCAESRPRILQSPHPLLSEILHHYNGLPSRRASGGFQAHTARCLGFEPLSNPFRSKFKYQRNTHVQYIELGDAGKDVDLQFRSSCCARKFCRGSQLHN